MHTFSRTLVLLNTLLLMAAGCAQTPPQVSQTTFDLSAALAEVQKRHSVPGIAVGIIKDGSVAEVGTAGVRKMGEPAALEHGDRFHLGSCTKLMTALMVYRLIDQHRLSLETTIGEVLKDVPMRPEYKAVTVGQLLQFKGGIAQYLFIDSDKTPEVFDSSGTPEEQRGRFVAHVLQLPPAAPPGTKPLYSNASYAVVAYLASRTTGKTWEQLVKENVFEPLKMSNAGFGRPTMTSGHVRSAGGWEPEPGGYVHPASISAAGDVSASMEDFGKFAAEELRIARGESTILSKSTADLLKANSDLQPGRTILGGAGSFTAGITLWPDANFAVVTAVNCGEGDQICRGVSLGLKGVYVDGKPFAEAPPSRKSYGFMLGLGENGAVMVGHVEPGSIAEEAGLKEGDVIVAMNDREIASIPDEERFAALHGKALNLKVKRGTQMLDIRMQIP